MSLAPGVVRDSIIECFLRLGREASIEEITNAVYLKIGEISKSSVRSYLSLNTPGLFERVDRGVYRLNGDAGITPSLSPKAVGKSTIFFDDAIEWLKRQKDNSIHAVVTDPPYGLVEYTKQQTEKLRAGKGGIWRKPPSFDGHKRAPLPRFTVLREEDLRNISLFFKELSSQVERVVVPGSADRPFGDVIKSHPTPAHEKKIAPHPSLKPQNFMRQLVRAVLPLGEGIILDPF
ncbi:hypothetical protein ACMFBQ_22435 (plasmid) [Enterobacter hormaechei]|uniref:hypothetical protein n=1 Tax=Enterobacter hormaechei TaxID=158836 RepID=UPI003CF3FF51